MRWALFGLGIMIGFCLKDLARILVWLVHHCAVAVLAYCQPGQPAPNLPLPFPDPKEHSKVILEAFHGDMTAAIDSVTTTMLYGDPGNSGYWLQVRRYLEIEQAGKSRGELRA